MTEVAMNRIKVAMLLAALTALLLWIGESLGGRQGLVLAMLLAGGMNFASYWWSDRIVLRMHGAQEVSEREAPELHAMVRRLARRAGLPMPRVYLMADEAPNAFATGRDPAHGAVAVTRGLMRVLDRDELAGVIAHELAHIQHRDTLVMTVAAALAGAISMLANMAQWALLFGRSREDEEGGSPLTGLVGILVAPLAAMLIQAAISRAREFEADAGGAEISAEPMALARALRKIEEWSHELPLQAGTPASAHLFIINPFAGGGMFRWFSTHPPTEERIARLAALSRRRLGLAA
jgi:heat shock protein HtpX